MSQDSVPQVQSDSAPAPRPSKPRQPSFSRRGDAIVRLVGDDHAHYSASHQLHGRIARRTARRARPKN